MTRQPKETKAPAPAAGASAFSTLPLHTPFRWQGDATNKPSHWRKVATQYAVNATTNKLRFFPADTLVEVTIGPR